MLNKKYIIINLKLKVCLGKDGLEFDYVRVYESDRAM